ncbi:MAG: Asp-tRNA(Asn)/Glu-tRNA(Gln) amidotransferase subunit GatC [Pseudomonadota bacterium]
MALDKATVQRIAALARIKVKEEDLGRMVGELQAILDWVEQLSELDTATVEPMAAAVAMTLPQRDDVVSDGAATADILLNAPEPVKAGEGGFFTVPKVLE